MNVGESGTLHGDGSWNEHWHGSQRVVRCSFDTTSKRETSWACFSWHVPCSGSVEELSSSVIEIVTKSPTLPTDQSINMY
jgi:hypothetical protein